VAGSGLGTSLAAVVVTLTSPLALSTGTTYWVVVTRDGASDNDNKYLVDKGYLLTGSVATNRQAVGDVLPSRVAQKFQVATGWDAYTLVVRAAATGTPADSLRVAIWSDSGGSPSASLASGTVAAADVGSAMGWVAIDLATPYALAAATDYWLVVERTGSADEANYYTVGLDSTLGYSGGGLKEYVDGAWALRTPDCDMPFQVWSEQATEEQIEAMLTAGQFVEGVQMRVTSGLSERQYRAGELSIRAEVELLLALGRSTGGGLAATTTLERTVIVEDEAAASDLDLVLGLDGVVRHPLGGELGAGVLPVGRWVQVEGVPETDTRLAPLRRLFVERAEYDVAGGRLRVTPRGTATGPA
jgi:hypothetical protein